MRTARRSSQGSFLAPDRRDLGGRVAPAGFPGWCGVLPLEQSGLVELGYRYVRAAWGHGIGTAAARAVLDHGFRALAIDPIVAVAHPDNRTSHRVLEKIGLQPAGQAWHYRQWLRFYRLTRAQHLAAG